MAHSDGEEQFHNGVPMPAGSPCFVYMSVLTPRLVCKNAGVACCGACLKVAAMEAWTCKRAEERKEGERREMLKSLRSSSGSEGRRRNYSQWLQDLRPELRQIKRTQLPRHNSFAAIEITPLDSKVASPKQQDQVSYDQYFERPRLQSGNRPIAVKA